MAERPTLVTYEECYEKWRAWWTQHLSSVFELMQVEDGER